MNWESAIPVIGALTSPLATQGARCDQTRHAREVGDSLGYTRHAMSGALSIESSSVITISKSRSLCAKALSRASRKIHARL
jgi:hypothetical protein